MSGFPPSSGRKCAAFAAAGNQPVHYEQARVVAFHVADEDVLRGEKVYDEADFPRD